MKTFSTFMACINESTMKTSPEGIKYQSKMVDISTIKSGDTVVIDNKLKTVSKSSLGKDGLLGITLFGDSYNSGKKKVEKAIIYRATPKVM